MEIIVSEIPPGGGGGGGGQTHIYPMAYYATLSGITQYTNTDSLLLYYERVVFKFIGVRLLET